ncbi:hypothetical protein Desca_0423 [Desulfotomaculum nigrificans CO-1-SRB]|uniref:Uncharacterized protein n=1 Tax=Desulfotomaculum nigrificans (strain DSM 14880 / VKM B-2319 / CO-1-SRB) TaxID=868595 RepID=F6B6Z2_DESCC|nr:hypothetical protein [Desulfotomaculum nigrificans]AEF93317.1 hypothetical protein Desca_0423 [Desulfotomaculum nigrificans CO-1-SRB]
MGKKVTFSEGAELLGVPISTISKWFSQGLFKSVDLDRQSPNGPTYLLRMEELLAIKDALEAEGKGLAMAKQEIAAAGEKKAEKKKSQNDDDTIVGRRKLSLVKANSKNNAVDNSNTGDSGREIVLRIQEDVVANLINTLTTYLNNFEQKFLQHLEEQADKNMLKYNTMAIEHLETLKDMSAKMETVVDALVAMPQKVTGETAEMVNKIKEIIPDINQITQANTGTNEKLEAVNKKLERLTEEIKDTKWAVVKLARENNKIGKKVKNKNKAASSGFGVNGLVSGLGKIFKLGR